MPELPSLGDFDASTPAKEPRFTIDLTASEKTIRLAVVPKWPNVFKLGILAPRTLTQIYSILVSLIAEDWFTPQPGAEPLDEDRINELKAAVEAAEGDEAKQQAVQALFDYRGPSDRDRLFEWYIQAEPEDRLIVAAVDAICKELTGHPLEFYAPSIASSSADEPGGPDTSEPLTA